MATETSSTGRDSDKFMLRFPEGMRSLIKKAAEENGRTMNAEIVARLDESFEGAVTQDEGTKALIVDQAKEQLSLRMRLTAAYLHLEIARRALEGMSWEKEKLESLESVLKSTEPHVRRLLRMDLAGGLDDKLWHAELPQDAVVHYGDPDVVRATLEHYANIAQRHLQGGDSEKSEPKAEAAPLPPAPTKRRINTTRGVQRKP